MCAALFSYHQTHFRLLVFTISLWCGSTMHAQPIAFKKLSTAHGLSDNLVHDADRDATGTVWIATAQGLNSFDGFEVKTWNHVMDTAVGTRDFRDVFVDDADRVWVFGTTSKIVYLDHRRRPQYVRFQHRSDSGAIRFIFPTRNQGIYLLVNHNLLKVEPGSHIARRIATLPDSVMRLTYVQESVHADKIGVIAGAGRVLLIDLHRGTLLKTYRLPNALCAWILPGGQMLVSTERNRQLYRIDTASGAILHNHGLLPDQYGRPVNGYLRYMAQMADGRMVITSGYGGVYVYDPGKNTLHNYAHDPLNEQSPSGNNTYKVRADDDGFVFVTTRSSGLNIFNSRYHHASTISRFREAQGLRIFDGFVGPVRQHANGNIWLGSQGGLMEWNRTNNTVKFHEYGVIDGESIAGKEEVRAIHFDAYGQTWVGLNRYGVVVLGKNLQPIRYFNTMATKDDDKLPSNFITDIKAGPDGLVWIATTRGLRFADPVKTRLVRPASPSLLDTFSSKYLNQVWVKSKDEIWLATTSGVWQYHPNQQKLRHYHRSTGLINTSILCITGDSMGNVYLGGRAGFDKLTPGGDLQHFDRSNGLPNDACVSMQADSRGNVWIANNNFMVCYQPATNGIHAFDNSYGFSGNGFRLISAYQSADGEMFFGCNEGVSFFRPEALLRSRQPVNLFISALKAGDTSLNFSRTDSVVLSHRQQSPTFMLSTVALHSTRAVRVQYRLEGYDEVWRDYEQGQLISYHNLDAGSYHFKARYAEGGEAWKLGQNVIVLTILAPWWRQWWFYLLMAASLLAVVWNIWRGIQRTRQLQKEEAETEKIILFLTSSLHSQSSISNMLWDVTRNCISKLKFEDCVIYLLDEEKQVLRQQAAWGPKTTEQNVIVQPLEIPVGKGIVGYVAAKAKATIVADTSVDPRYIVDDQVRHAEIAVPIIAEGKVLGVIDSEHSKKNFFTQRHLSILTTIASVLGSKMVSAKAEEDRRTAELALLENRQRTSEVEMKALRAQMNPHFMFNSLNSINNFILKSDADNASAYLTRFARLMRLILDNSRHEWVSLENELKALGLYIKMESLRFDNVFACEVEVDEIIDPVTVFIPPMIIQPYVENAIWHGLLHRKEPGSRLTIRVSRKNEWLRIVIEDNGVGRTAAAAMKSKFGSHKQSHGMQITAERLQMVNDVYHIDASADVEDILNGNGHVAGTRVLLTMKFRNHEVHNY